MAGGCPRQTGCRRRRLAEVITGIRGCRRAHCRRSRRVRRPREVRAAQEGISRRAPVRRPHTARGRRRCLAVGILLIRRLECTTTMSSRGRSHGSRHSTGCKCVAGEGAEEEGGACERRRQRRCRASARARRAAEEVEEAAGGRRDTTRASRADRMDIDKLMSEWWRWIEWRGGGIDGVLLVFVMCVSLCVPVETDLREL